MVNQQIAGINNYEEEDKQQRNTLIDHPTQKKEMIGEISYVTTKKVDFPGDNKKLAKNKKVHEIKPKSREPNI